MSYIDRQRQRLLLALGLPSAAGSVLDLWKLYLDALGIRPRETLVARFRAYAPQYPASLEWMALPTQALAFTATNPPDGQVSVVYSYQFAASGGTAPYTFTVQAGTIPPGTTLSSAGLLDGTPNTANTYNFTVRVTDAVGLFVDSPVDVIIIP